MPQVAVRYPAAIFCDLYAIKPIIPTILWPILHKIEIFHHFVAYTPQKILPLQQNIKKDSL